MSATAPSPRGLGEPQPLELVIAPYITHVALPEQIIYGQRLASGNPVRGAERAGPAEPTWALYPPSSQSIQPEGPRCPLLTTDGRWGQDAAGQDRLLALRQLATDLPSYSGTQDPVAGSGTRGQPTWDRPLSVWG